MIRQATERLAQTHPTNDSGESNAAVTVGTLSRGGRYVEVDLEKTPSEGEVLVFTAGGGFVVKGSLRDIVSKFSSEEWPSFELAESGDALVIRSSKVVALRSGDTRRHRGNIGFMHRP